MNRTPLKPVVNQSRNLLLALALVLSCGNNPQKETKRKMATVMYTDHPAFTYTVGKKNTGKDVRQVVVQLRKASIRSVIFRSAYKLQQPEVDRINRLFENSGISIFEFWVPDSDTPGFIDLKKVQE